ncbi:GNAT family N-acetyltransferase [Ornithinimicrobium pratense]|uniref:GNAT family N-acetyltransferase n=1 Tax=Ornithinimicrobium pratense TaxID=2593973 RepID=A0A5J6V839_9MICO|nr:GNAT family protein [Ornithinimicrobium pratense]QFG69975.1 GNAT family N-acetyltransferase [Ornithinimicrobium pratense]
MYDIRPVRAEEWRESRDLQLRALQDEDAAVAFFETYDEALVKPEEEWRNWAKMAGSDAEGTPFIRDFVAVTLFGEWVATSTLLIRMAGDPELGGGTVETDRGEFIGVWIDPQHRGQGLFTRLVEAGMSWLADNAISRSALWVHEENGRARRAFEGVGFERTGLRVVESKGPEIQLGRPVRLDSSAGLGGAVGGYSAPQATSRGPFPAP